MGSAPSRAVDVRADAKMQPREFSGPRDGDTNDPIRVVRRIVFLILLPWFLLGIELLGGSRYGGTPIHLGPLQSVKWLAVIGVFVTPLFIVFGFSIALMNRSLIRKRQRWFPALLLLLLMSSLITLVNCAVTFGGHPVWVDGFRK